MTNSALNSFKNTFLLLCCLALSACGGDSDPTDTNDNTNNTDTIIPNTILDLPAELKSFLESQDGQMDNTPVTYTGTPSATLQFHGYSFCTPIDLYAQPIIPAAPSENIFGCANTISVEYTGMPSPTQIEFSVVLPELYFGFSGEYSLPPFPVKPINGYLTDINTTINLILHITTTDDGNYTIDTSTPPIATIAFSSLYFESDDGNLNNISGTLTTTIADSLDDDLALAISELIQTLTFTEFTLPN